MMEKEIKLRPAIVNEIYNWLRKGVYNLKQNGYSSKKLIIHVPSGFISELEFLKPAGSSALGDFVDQSLMFYGVDILSSNKDNTIIITNLKDGYEPRQVITYTIDVKETGGTRFLKNVPVS